MTPGRAQSFVVGDCHEVARVDEASLRGQVSGGIARRCALVGDAGRAVGGAEDWARAVWRRGRRHDGRARDRDRRAVDRLGQVHHPPGRGPVCGARWDRVTEGRLELGGRVPTRWQRATAGSEPAPTLDAGPFELGGGEVEAVQQRLGQGVERVQVGAEMVVGVDGDEHRAGAVGSSQQNYPRPVAVGDQPPREPEVRWREQVHAHLPRWAQGRCVRRVRRDGDVHLEPVQTAHRDRVRVTRVEVGVVSQPGDQFLGRPPDRLVGYGAIDAFGVAPRRGPATKRPHR